MTKYTLNDRFFDVIDTEYKAYFLGLMFADGCVMDNGSSFRIRIGLHKRDSDIIHSFRDCLEYTGPIYNTPTRATLEMSSRVLGEALCKHGCIPRKSLVLRFPVIPGQMIWHFIRGYFDGDGCLTLGRRDGAFTLCGTEPFLVSVKSCFADIGITSALYLQPKSRIYILRVRGNRQIFHLLNHLYENATLCLARKYQKFQDLVSIMKTVRVLNRRGILPGVEKENKNGTNETGVRSNP